ncbi:MAG: DUF2238 domain-containing protein [Prosthecobacter sp.]|nr:DUF2238 domain-containing protein [Prosthecobacter sp.]
MAASPPPPPPLWRILLFTTAYILAAVVGSYVQGNREFVFYIVVMLVLIAAVAVVHWRVRLTGGLLWALSIWGLLHMAGGLVPVPPGLPYNGDHDVLYSLWIIPQRLKYDQVVHAYGFGVTTWVCWHALSASLLRTKYVTLPPTFGMLTLCAAAGMGFGALNEVVEFIAVLTIPNTNVGGYDNTGWDLVSNLVGVIGAALLIRIRCHLAA